MNRADPQETRAAAAVIARSLAAKVAATYECPDCHVETCVRRDEAGVFHVEIAHDHTCPWFARYEQARGR